MIAFIKDPAAECKALKLKGGQLTAENREPLLIFYVWSLIAAINLH